MSLVVWSDGTSELHLPHPPVANSIGLSQISLMAWFQPFRLHWLLTFANDFVSETTTKKIHLILKLHVLFHS